jgi:uncharacterized protein
MQVLINQNQLSKQNSAYLKQHQNDPVHWQIWSEEILTIAKESGKPIFLSIGYSTCHWCHVMAKESFNDENIARLLNEKFVNIKVDKEEHPEVDQYFQKISAMTTGRGGWPLSVFLTENAEVITIGTYFPNIAKDGMPSFSQVIEQVNQFNQDKKEAIKQQNLELTKALGQGIQIEKKIEFPGEFPHPQAILQAIGQYEDKEFGGYGDAPKFPNFSFYEWAIEQALEGMISQEQLNHIIKSIEAILSGGIYDQARGGLHRYSTDKKWLIPHFEKMLCDQAGLIKLLAKTSLIAPTPLILDGLIQTLDYLKKEMLADAGYFFSAQDADSEGVEGLYFCFSEEEFEIAVLNFDPELADKLDQLKSWFGISSKGNFEQGLNCIHLDVNKKNEWLTQENWPLIRSVKQALKEARAERIPPLTDTKGIASWNFMLLSSLCDVVQYCQIDVIRKLAMDMIDQYSESMINTFVKPDKELKTDTSQIHHTTTNARTPLLLEDYAFFCESQLRLFEISSNSAFLDNVKKSIDFIMDNFFRDGKFYPIEPSQSKSAITSVPCELFDQGHRNPVAMMIGLIRKLSLIGEFNHQLSKLEGELEYYKQIALIGPINSGELLRSVCYPVQSYKVIKVPKNWYPTQEFTRLISYFSTRFLIYYTDSDQFEICNHQTCEHTGDDLTTLVRLFVPAAESTNAQ